MLMVQMTGIRRDNSVALQQNGRNRETRDYSVFAVMRPPICQAATAIKPWNGVNPVDTLMVPTVALPTKNRKHLSKPVARITFGQFL